MKNLTLIGLLLILSAIFSGCSQKPNGKFVSPQNSNLYVELKSDGSCLIHSEAGGFTGKYSIDGDEILMKADIGMAEKVKLRDDKLVWDNGNVYVKQK